MRVKIPLIVLLLLPLILKADYWQQKVIYDIDVTLVDSLNQVAGYETITYINNSPDDLNFIWMHLWPNAYKNNESALARQKFNSFSTKMHFLPDSSFGWIDISDVSTQGQELKWEYRSLDTLDVAKFFLNEPLMSGDTIIIDLDFAVRVPNVLSRLGHFGHHYEMTQWYPKPAVYDWKGWHPMSYLDMGEFYSEWGDFDVSITLPENYRVAATGVLQDSSEIVWRDSLVQIGSTYLDSFKMDPRPKLPGLKALIEEKPSSSSTLKTITFKQENVHDFAWFADKRFVILRDSVSLPSGRRAATWTFALPANLKNYRLSNAYIGDAVSFYSKKFMEYPYDHVTVVDGDFSAGGGMEYPMITLINNTGIPPMLEMVIMHEVGHNWFYGLSASNERDYPWMDEGLNSYAENRYWATKYSDDSMLALHGEKPVWYPILEYFIKDPTKSAIEDVSYYLSAGPKMDQAPDLHSEAFTDFNYGMMVYKKAAVSTESLESYLGASLMDSVWHEYFRRWAYKHPQPEDIRQVFEEISGEDLSWYFDGMLGSTGQIDYALDKYECKPQDDAFETSINVKNLGDFSPPLPIGLFGDSEQRVIWVHPGDQHDEFKLKTNFNVTNVVLDPNQNLLDLNRSNNDRKLNLALNLARLDLNSRADYSVTAIPYLWYNTIDNIHPSLILTHKNFMPWKNADWYLRTFYGPVSQKGGYVAAIRKKYVTGAGRETKLSARSVQGWSHRLGEFSTSFNKRDLFLTDDKQSLKFSLLYQDIADGELILKGDTIRYLDPQIWQNGEYLRLNANFFSVKRRTLWTRKFEFNTLVGARADAKPFAKIQSYLNFRNRYSRKGSIRTTLFAGYAFGDLPTQDRYYLSTDMNPSMDHKFFVSRGTSWYAAGHRILYPGEYNIPGYLYSNETATVPSTKGLMGIKVRADIPKMEDFNILTGIALALDDSDDKVELIGSISPVFKMGPIQFIYTPIRIESDRIKTDWTRFQIAYDATTAGSIRIGI